MLKRILLTSLTIALVAGLCAGYFYHVGTHVREQRRGALCSGVGIRVCDSASNRLVCCSDVERMLGEFAACTGVSIDSVDLHGIEEHLDSQGEILKSQAYMLKDGTLRIDVRQRQAVVRFLTDGGYSFYSDPEGFVFPVTSIVDVPLVTGNLPHRPGKRWLASMIELTSYIESRDYWRKMIGQIDVEDNGDIVLYPREGGIRILFGDAGEVADKFSRIEKYYRCIVPARKDRPCSEVSVKYRNQIICK